MTPREAQSIGRSKTIKATIVCLAIPLFILLLRETNGDFANGILFFIAGVFTTLNFIILSIIFSLTILFGSMAGKNIIIEKKNTIVTSIKYVALIFLTICIFIFIAGTIYGTEQVSQETSLFKFTLWSAVLASIKITIPLLAAWLYATFRMQALSAGKR